MADVIVHVEPLFLNISPELFHHYAKQYYACKQSFINEGKFSPLPYFLLCRCIELELKSRHLKTKKRAVVKSQYNHSIIKLYDDLAPGEKILACDEHDLLNTLSQKYHQKKEFEYIAVEDACTGFSSFPNLEVLDRIAHKLLMSFPES